MISRLNLRAMDLSIGTFSELWFCSFVLSHVPVVTVNHSNHRPYIEADTLQLVEASKVSNVDQCQLAREQLGEGLIHG